MSSEVLEGSVESIIFSNSENGYTVFDFVKGQEVITVKGYFSTLHEGDFLKLTGRWTSHPDYGDQFSAESYEYEAPATYDAVLKFLSSGIFPGIGKITAERILDTFGDQTLNIIRESPERLAEIRGITNEKAKNIGEVFLDKYDLGQITMYLQQFGIGSSLTYKIYKLYGANSIEVIKENPYRLANEVQGIGFKIADNIALKLGLPKDSIERECSGLKYVLNIATQNGHVYLPKDILIRESGKILGVNKEGLNDALLDLEVKGEIKSINEGDDAKVYLIDMYLYESYIARRLIELSNEELQREIPDVDKRIKVYERNENIQLAQNQVKAIKESLGNGVAVITGGPGTGKTTIIKGIISIFQDEGFKVAIAAPTGRAAKRITEATGYEAKTIHRLLEPNFVMDDDKIVFNRDKKNPLDADVVIIDEVSMVDVQIMYNLLSALKDGTRLILAGDADQLPSVGCGRVLNSIIESDTVCTVKLNEIFRQAESSLIVVNAHSINQGNMPVLNDKDGDFYLMHRERIEDVVSLIVDLCSYRLPDAYGYDPFKDIQVLTPVRRGSAGVEGLNEVLQDRLNPKARGKNERQVKNQIFRVGDKVMQIRNNYNLKWENKYDNSIYGEGVFNGDMGIITEINNISRRIVVEYDDERLVEYDYTIFDQLEHAYAITIHKSQGSEFDVVIIPVCPGPPMLYTRNLIYTAVTRARKLVVLVGSAQILKNMVDNTHEQMRYTSLTEFLQNAWKLHS